MNVTFKQGLTGFMGARLLRLNTYAFPPEFRSITIAYLVHLRHSTQITDNGIGKRHLVSLRLKPTKNAF